MKVLICSLLVLVILSCTKSDSTKVSPDYADWYTVIAPIDDVIQAIWGNYDKTMLIATTYSLYRSTDKGRSWQQVDQQQTSYSGVVNYSDTLFSMNGIVNQGDNQLVANIGKYSIDDGKSWKMYQKYNPYFDTKFSQPSTNRSLYLNQITAINGTVYKINKIYQDGPSNLIRRYETPGVITTDGRKINLPLRHQLRSLNMDDRNRLYLVATDEICDINNSKVVFCNSTNGRGIVYISKQPLP